MMGEEPIILGILGIITAIILYVKTDLLFLSIILGVLGLLLIIFNKEETRIEQRKDIKTKKSKK
jgi:uncharacterized membrane protein